MISVTSPNLTTTGTASERLDRVGPQYIINIVANGGRLRTKGRTLEKGILNDIDVTEQEFTVWLAGQSVEAQQGYYAAIALAAKNITSDVLHHSLDVIEEINDLLSEERERSNKIRSLEVKAS